MFRLCAVTDINSRLAGVLVAPNALVLLKLNIFDASAIEHSQNVRLIRIIRVVHRPKHRLNGKI